MSQETPYDHISPTFCHLPFSTIFIATAGMPNPCCYSEFANQEDIKRIPDQSINDYWQAEKLAHLRKQLLNGEKPKSCWWCWVDEENGMESKRTRDSHQLNSYTESLYGDITQESYTKLVDKIVTNPEPLYIETQLGNLCNLGCRMCSPFASSIIEEEAKININKFTNKKLHMDIVSPLESIAKEKDWYKDEQFIQDFQSYLPSVHGLNVTGGEPTVNRYFNDMLDYCIKTDVAKDIQLNFTTNAQQINRQYMDKINQFKKIHMVLSIDGLNDVYEYIRYKALFKLLETNIKLFKDYESNHFKILSEPTYQVLNICDLAETLVWHEQNNIDWNILNPVHVPKYHDIKCLPSNVRRVARQKLINFLDEYNLNDFQIENVNNVISHTLIEDVDFQKEYFPIFIEHMDTLDSIRKTKLKDSVPALFNLL